MRVRSDGFLKQFRRLRDQRFELVLAVWDTCVVDAHSVETRVFLAPTRLRTLLLALSQPLRTPLVALGLMSEPSLLTWVRWTRMT